MRKAQLNSLSQFIEDAEKQVDQLLECFGWNKADLLNTKYPQQIDQKPTASGPDAFPESFYDEQHPFTVKVDKCLQAKILLEAQNNSGLSSSLPLARETPTNHEDLLVNFSAEERLTLDQYVLRNTPIIEPLQEIQISFKKQNKDAKMTSLADIAAYRRNMFRRNQKYRVAKNPLTYQEEVRNLIQMQTDAMTEYLEAGKVKQRESREDVVVEKRKRAKGDDGDRSHRKRKSRFD